MDGLTYFASDDLISMLLHARGAGLEHLMRYDQAEGQHASLAGLWQAAGVLHWMEHGRHEGQTQDGFDAEAWLATNADLHAAFDTDLHAATGLYIWFGHGEGRSGDPF